MAKRAPKQEGYSWICPMDEKRGQVLISNLPLQGVRWLR